uniref:Uncharacterized protein n=1 Tax=Magnetococcus massalia (strain MO-1) TaxID=451514 RepID=A0A1S7LHB5_MAGMO|nr:Exported protein of unknown function[Include ankyrin repeats] [Candidatus Magnetococcus massalia]
MHPPLWPVLLVLLFSSNSWATTPPLHQSIIDNKVVVAQQLIQAGADLNQFDAHGLAPIHHAVRSGHQALVAQILQLDASQSNLQDAQGIPPLWHTLDLITPCRRLSIFEQLLQHGAQADYKLTHHAPLRTGVGWFIHPDYPQLAYHPDTAPPLWANQPFIHGQNLSCPGCTLLLLLSQQPAYRSGNHQSGYTQEQQQCQAQAARLLLTHGADANQRHQLTTNTPLHGAVQNRHHSLQKVLLQQGAEINIPGAMGWTSLHYAVAQQDGDATAWLLDHGAAFTADLAGDTPLHLASRAVWQQGIAMLLTHKAPKGLTNRMGLTAQEMVNHPNIKQIAALFTQSSGEKEASLQQLSVDNRTPAPRLTKYTTMQLQSALIQGLDPNQPDSLGTPLIFEALYHRKIESLCLLLAYHADADTPFPPFPISLGICHHCTPLMTLARLPDMRSFTPATIYEETLRFLDHAEDLLLSAKVDIQRKNRVDGESILASAVRYGRNKLVKKLLARGAHPDSQNHHGRTALHHAVLTLNREALDQLLQRGADTDLQDLEGNTPLHLAIISNWSDGANRLVRYQADPSIKNRLGLDAHAIAQQVGWKKRSEI